MHKKSIKVLFFIVFNFFSFQKTFSQCLDIESILVGACSSGTNEGFNEMVRFKIGSVPQNINSLVVTWPNLTWLGVIQSPTTQAKVAALNVDIIAAGGGLCNYRLKEPPGGIIPANASVILVTSYLMDTTQNTFGVLTSDIYIIFQNNPTVITGHFANSGAGTRTLSMTFGGTCSDTVSYDRSLLIGGASGSDGATVLYTPSGTASYVNNGCVAPVPLFTVDAGTVPSVCSGATIALSGTAQGQQSVTWSAPSGTFSSSISSNTNYTVAAGVTGNVVLTLTATNSCGLVITDTVTLDVTPAIIPTFTQVPAICSGASLTLPLTSINTTPISGTWSPVINNTSNTTYTFTPTSSLCTSTAQMTVTVTPKTITTFTQVPAICTGTTLTLPITSTNTPAISGTWSPAFDNTMTMPYTFTPTTGVCATTASMTVTVTPKTITTFTQVPAICYGAALTLSPNSSNTPSISGTWSPAFDNTMTMPYTFTPTTGVCATTASMTVTVTPKTITTFTQVPAICYGAALTLSPNSSNTPSISGTWSPVFDNTMTMPYTFSPTTGVCATTASMTVTVTPKTITTFTQVPAICTGTTLTLPITSTNTPAISGTWSPAFDNTMTMPYTFTPTTGVCATTASMTVTVQSAIDFTISGICEGPNFVLNLEPIGAAFNPTTSFSWQNSSNATVGTNDANFNVSTYFSLVSLPLPQVFSASVTDSNGCVSIKPYAVTSLYCSIQKGISPNGDGDNEFFDLHLLDVKALSIFNRYGVKVYFKSNYRNEWHGETNSGKQLPDGTYYYAIELNSNSEAKTGWIYINR